jgi:hypothetical protein
MVMVHGLGFSGRRHGHFQHTHEAILEDHLVTIGRCLHRIVPGGKA